MKTYLINTLINFWSSPQGPARLYSYLRKRGVDITFLNLNHNIYSYFFSEKTIKSILEEVRPLFLSVLARDRFYRENFGSILINSSGGKIFNLFADIISGDKKSVIDSIPFSYQIKSTIAKYKLNKGNIPYILFGYIDEIAKRIGDTQKEIDKKFFKQSSEELLKQVDIILCGKAIIDAIYYPSMIDLGYGFWGCEGDVTAEDVIRSTKDERHNYMIRFFNEQVMPQLIKEEPDIIGLSATHPTEFSPVFTLASIIKKHLPETHITLGGVAFSDIRTRVMKNNCLWQDIDSFVYGRGEIAFTQLIKTLDGDKNLKKVPNLIYKEKDEIIISNNTADISPNDLTVPEYVDLRPG